MENSRTSPLSSNFLILVPVLLVFYLPLLDNGFVNWDDPQVILNNIHIRSLNLSSLQWMLTSFHTGNWMPLTWLTFTVNYGLGGLEPKSYHLTNLLIHLMNTGLVFLLVGRLLSLGGRSGEKTFEIFTALLSALLFGLHPMHVESVAWASERKDVLYAFFFLLSVYSYLGIFTSSDRKGYRFWACWVFFLLALISKPMAVTLPLVLLILDYWPLKRLGSNFLSLLTEKIPFLLVAWIAILAQDEASAFTPAENWPISFRILNAFRSLAFYPFKLLIPRNLSPLYPISPNLSGPFYLQSFLGIGMVLLVTVVCFFRRKKGPFFAAAWLLYLVTLAPVLGIFQVGSQAVADRYAYLASLALFIPFSAVVSSRLAHHRLVFVLICAVLTGLLGYGTREQIKIWKDSQTLWERVVGLYPGQSAVAHTNLGSAYEKAGRMDDALREYQSAAAIPPPLAITHNGIGAILFFKGRTAEAVREFQYAISLNPHYGAPHRNLWYIFQSRGMKGEALAEIQKAVEIDPDNPDFNQYLAQTLQAADKK